MQKTARQLRKKDEQHENKEELEMKRPKATHLEEPKLMIANDGKFHEGLLESCKIWCGNYGCVCARSS